MEYTTDFTDKDQLNSDGCQVEYFFEDIIKRGVGILTVENGEVYVCQNDFDGKECFDRKGLNYSYVLNLTEPSNSSYYKERIQKLYKQKSLVGRYLKALVDNAQNSHVIKNNFYKIVFEPNQNPTVLGVELVKGEYYVVETNNKIILKFDKIENDKICVLGTLYDDGDYYGKGIWGDATSIRSIRVANFSERLWLDKCIAAGKFIPKEEALEEKEFVLPEKWCIKISKENIGICQKHNVLSKSYNYDYTIGAYYGNKMGGDYKIPENTTEITFEQFKKYVLKEDTFIDTFNPLAEPSTEKPVHEYEKLRSYIKDETLKLVGLTPLDLGFNTLNKEKKSDLEFQEPVIIKSIKNKPKLIIINN